MRLTYAPSHGHCIRCDACGGGGNSTSRIIVADVDDEDCYPDGRLYRSAMHGLRDHAARTLTFEACPSCVTKLARRCDVCGNDKMVDRDHCPDCARAFAVADRQETIMAKTLQQITDMLAAQDKHLDTALKSVTEWLRAGNNTNAGIVWSQLPAAFRAKYAGITEGGDLIPSMEGKIGFYGVAPASAADQIAASLRILRSAGIDVSDVNTSAAPAVQAPEETPMTTKTETPSLRSELDDAAWQAGVELFTEEARDFLASLLTDELTPDEAAIAAPLIRKALTGRFGVPIVAGAIGGIQRSLEASGVAVPIVSAEVAARIGREMRVLTSREVIKVAYRSGRDLLAKHGGKMLDALTNLGKIADRTGVRVEGDLPVTESATWPVGAAEAAKTARNGAAS